MKDVKKWTNAYNLLSSQYWFYQITLSELEAKDILIKAMSTKQKKNREDIHSILYHRDLLYVSELIQIGRICKHHNDVLIGDFESEKIK